MNILVFGDGIAWGAFDKERVLMCLKGWQEIRSEMGISASE